ncbi:hypothetical protein D3C84_421170 [compost metagenome]
MRVSLPTRIGRSTLSTRPITRMPKSANPTPCQSAPLIMKNSATGPQTIPAPTSGSSERKAIITPQNTGLGMSSTQNTRPPSAPWTMETTMLPFTVARTTRVNLICSRRLCCSPRGIAMRTLRATSRPSRRKKNSR